MKRMEVPPRTVDLSGAFVPFYADQGGDQPVIVGIEDVHFVPVFTTVDKLEEQLPTIQPQGPVKIKQIDDGGTILFLDSVFAEGLRVMLDPYTIGDKTYWTEVVRQTPPPQQLEVK